MFRAQVIEKSVNSAGVVICTMMVEYPRFVHAELMTHRVFSRNASSSRAIPVKRLIESIITEPGEPIFWGSNQPGMQAATELEGWRLSGVKMLWALHRRISCSMAGMMSSLGAHKQIVNRIIENHGHIKVVITSTYWDNFWNLRLHKDAQPEMRRLAVTMHKAYHTKIPTPLKDGEWHLPFVTDLEKKAYPIEDLVKFSVARNARVSFNQMDGRSPIPDGDRALYDRLVGGVPEHASPVEHPAQADARGQNKDRWGNFFGFAQLRFIESPTGMAKMEDHKLQKRTSKPKKVTAKKK